MTIFLMIVYLRDLFCGAMRRLFCAGGRRIHVERHLSLGIGEANA
jgi:hypothetical protein